MICWKQPSAPEGNKTKTFEQPFILCAKTLTACNEKTIGEIKLCNVAKAKKQKKGESPTVWNYSQAPLLLCVCIVVCVKKSVQIQAWQALKWVAFDSLVFVFMAQDQSQVALKLTLGGLTLCIIAEQNPEERSSSLMWIQKPEFPLHNTISQVKAMSAPMKLIPTVRLCCGSEY